MANMTATNHTNIPCDPFVNFCAAGMVSLLLPASILPATPACL